MYQCRPNTIAYYCGLYVIHKMNHGEPNKITIQELQSKLDYSKQALYQALNKMVHKNSMEKNKIDSSYKLTEIGINYFQNVYNYLTNESKNVKNDFKEFINHFHSDFINTKNELTNLKNEFYNFKQEFIEYKQKIKILEKAVANSV